MTISVATELMKQGRWAEAEAQLWHLIRDHEDAQLWVRLGELYVATGALRRALGAFRRAQEVDARGTSALTLHQAVSSLGQLLHQQHKPFLHPSDETRRTKRLVLGCAPEPVDVETWLKTARELEASLSTERRASLSSAIEFVASNALTEPYSEQAVAATLEREVPEAASLVAALRALHLERYERLLDADEPAPR